MSKPGLLAATAILFSVTLLACSGDDDGAGSYKNIPASFSKYCTGTLKGDKELMEPYGSGWMGGMDSPSAAAGSVFVVGDEFGGVSGFVFNSDGGPLMISTEFGEGLVKGTDFTSDCALDGNQKTDSVLMLDAVLYSNEQLSGSTCTVPAGTTLSNYSFAANLSAQTAKVSSDEIKQLCGWEIAWSKQFVEARLYLK